MRRLSFADRLRERLGSVISVGFAGIALLFLTLPIVALFIRAANNQAWQGTNTDAVSTGLRLSLESTALTVMLTALFGTPLAYLLARRRFRFKRLISVLVELPIVLPPAVAGLALLIAFGRRGVIGAGLASLDVSLAFTFAAVVMAQTFVAAPFFIRAAQIGFQAVPRELEDAARVDGAGGWALFRKVTLPLAARALSAGLILCWARALGEFGATILFAGSLQGRTQTMPLLIYNIIERDIDAAIWTGLLLIGFAGIALIAAKVLERGAEAAL
jgi:molybdate transport system permease protein